MWKDNCISSSKTIMKNKKQNNPSSSDQRDDEQIWRSDAPDIPEHGEPKTYGEAKASNKKSPGNPERNEQQENQNYLTKEDLPDATNESKGKMGSGLRQDSN
jgi:hypothetical protein